MDILVQQNLTKKNLIAIDIGFDTIKVIEANIIKGKIKVQKSFIIPKAYRYFGGTELNMIPELVSEINKRLKDLGVRTKEVRVVLPSICTQYKTIEAKAVKDKELAAFVTAESGSMLSKASSTINCTDWCVLGQSENGEENTKTCLVTSIPRKIAFGIASEFEKLRYSVKVMTVPLLTMRSAADLYKADYEHPVKLYVDFGATSVRMVVANAGEVTFTREYYVGGHNIINDIYEELVRTGSSNSDSVVGSSNLSIDGLKELLADIGVSMISATAGSEDAYTDFTSDESSMYDSYESYNAAMEKENSADSSEEIIGSEFTPSSEEDNTMSEETALAMDKLMQYGINMIQYNELVERHYDAVISEVIKTLDFCGEGISKPTKIIYSGGMTKVKGFIDRLDEAVDIALEEFNPVEHSTGSGYSIEYMAGTNVNSNFLNAIGVCTDVLV